MNPSRNSVPSLPSSTKTLARTSCPSAPNTSRCSIATAAFLGDERNCTFADRTASLGNSFSSWSSTWCLRLHPDRGQGFFVPQSRDECPGPKQLKHSLRRMQKYSLSLVLNPLNSSQASSRCDPSHRKQNGFRPPFFPGLFSKLDLFSGPFLSGAVVVGCARTAGLNAGLLVGPFDCSAARLCAF